MLKVVLRIVIYGLIMVMLNQLMFIDAGQQGQEMKFMESTFTEWTQQLILLIMTAIFAHCSFHFTSFQCLSVLLAGMSAIGLVREFNNFFNSQIFDGAWQLLALVVLFITAVLIRKYQRFFWDDLKDFQGTLSFGFMLAGFLTTFIFSRLFGRTVFWEALMEERYFRSVKNAAEEGVELLGYGLLLVATVEYFLLARSKNKQGDGISP